VSDAASEPAPGSERENAGGEPRQVAPLLRLASRDHDGEPACVLDEIDDGGGRARPRDLLDREAEGEHAQPGATIRLGDVEPHETRLAEPPELVGRVGVRLVHLRGERRDPLAGNGPDEVAHLALLVGQIEGVAHPRSLSVTSGPRTIRGGPARALDDPL